MDVLQSEVQLLTELVILLILEQRSHVAPVATCLEFVDHQSPARLEPVRSVRREVMEYGAIERNLNHGAFRFRSVEGPCQLQVQTNREHLARLHIKAWHHHGALSGRQEILRFNAQSETGNRTRTRIAQDKRSVQVESNGSASHAAGTGRKAERHGENRRIAWELDIEPSR